jgi:hypothetical protein
VRSWEWPYRPGGALRLQVQSGTAIIYGATADNTTQDPSLSTRE